MIKNAGKFYIYVLINKINGKLYIGQTQNFSRRMARHKYDANNGCSYSVHRAIRKYGWNNFKKEIIDESYSLEEILLKENFWIKYCFSKNHRYGYNLIDGGRQPSNWKPQKEIINKFSGENNGRAKMSQQDACNIRKRYLMGQINIQDLAKEYCCSATCIERIIKNKTYYDHNYIVDFAALKRARAATAKYTTKISKDKINIIVNEYLNSNSSQKDLANKYNVSLSAIGHLLKKGRSSLISKEDLDSIKDKAIKNSSSIKTLTENDVYFIRSKYKKRSEKYNAVELSKICKVTPRTILDVFHKKTWKNI